MSADTELPAAEIAGRLTLVNGCLMVAPAAAAVVPVVLPDQAVWDPEDESVSMGDENFAVGDEVAWSGAYGFASEELGVPSTCPDVPEVGIVYEMPATR